MAKNLKVDAHHWRQAMIGFRQALETTRFMAKCEASRRAHQLAETSYEQLLLARKLVRDRQGRPSSLSQEA